jgi:hypothetical protein
MPEPSPPDKAALLAKLLFEQSPLCAACISAKSGFPVADIEPTVRRFEQTLAVRRDMGHCKVCERWTLVYALFGVQRRT